MTSRPPRAQRAAGAALPELALALALLALLLLVGLGAAARQVARQRALVAARRLQSEVRLRRAEAISRARRQGLAFRRSAAGWSVTLHADGDGDGLRADDMRRGVDPVLDGPEPFAVRYGAARPGFLPQLDRLRSPPPGSRLLPDLDDPVRLGVSDVVSFSPLGNTTTGTVYLTDGHERQLAVVLYGGTGRVRVWEWLVPQQRWVSR